MTPNRRPEPLFDVHPLTGASIEVFYADRALETFGKCGSGWFWWSRRRGFAPHGSATGPFATSYAAYRHALNGSDLFPLTARATPFYGATPGTANTNRTSCQ
jgi:hypothetical protein